MEEVEICLIYLDDKPIICEQCKQLNNKQNTICIYCNGKFIYKTRKE